jgi:hypothetical protein
VDIFITSQPSEKVKVRILLTGLGQSYVMNADDVHGRSGSRAYSALERSASTGSAHMSVDQPQMFCGSKTRFVAACIVVGAGAIRMSKLFLQEKDNVAVSRA